MAPVNPKKGNSSRPKGKNKNRKKKQKNLVTTSTDQKLGNKSKPKGLKKHKWSEAREVKNKKLFKDDPPKNADKPLAFQVKSAKTKVGSVGSAKPVSKDNVKTTNKVGKKLKPSPDEPKESLRDRMVKRLQAARFRQINEELDNSDMTVGSNPAAAFESDPELFQKYHEAYKGQMEQWPKNPLDTIVKWINRKVSKDRVIADFGCGEAKLSISVPNKVHSFDLFALNDRVTACDMSNVPLEDESVDVAVFCLSLMGTDVGKFIAEANRVLKTNGILKIAEVASRFSGNTFTAFLKRMKKFGFAARQKGQKSNDSAEADSVFLVFEFVKIKTLNKSIGSLPSLRLSPSVYKKR